MKALTTNDAYMHHETFGFPWQCPSDIGSAWAEMAG